MSSRQNQNRPDVSSNDSEARRQAIYGRAESSAMSHKTVTEKDKSSIKFVEHLRSINDVKEKMRTGKRQNKHFKDFFEYPICKGDEEYYYDDVDEKALHKISQLDCESELEDRRARYKELKTFWDELNDSEDESQNDESSDEKPAKRKKVRKEKQIKKVQSEESEDDDSDNFDNSDDDLDEIDDDEEDEDALEDEYESEREKKTKKEKKTKNRAPRTNSGHVELSDLHRAQVFFDDICLLTLKSNFKKLRAIINFTNTDSKTKTVKNYIGKIINIVETEEYEVKPQLKTPYLLKVVNLFDEEQKFDVKINAVLKTKITQEQLDEGIASGHFAVKTDIESMVQSLTKLNENDTSDDMLERHYRMVQMGTHNPRFLEGVLAEYRQALQKLMDQEIDEEREFKETKDHLTAVISEIIGLIQKKNVNTISSRPKLTGQKPCSFDRAVEAAKKQKNSQNQETPALDLSKVQTEEEKRAALHDAAIKAGLLDEGGDSDEDDDDFPMK